MWRGFWRIEIWDHYIVVNALRKYLVGVSVGCWSLIQQNQDIQVLNIYNSLQSMEKCGIFLNTGILL